MTQLCQRPKRAAHGRNVGWSVFGRVSAGHQRLGATQTSRRPRAARRRDGRRTLQTWYHLNDQRTSGGISLSGRSLPFMEHLLLGVISTTLIEGRHIYPLTSKDNSQPWLCTVRTIQILKDALRPPPLAYNTNLQIKYRKTGCSIMTDRDCSQSCR